MAKRLKPFFERLGHDAAAAARPLLDARIGTRGSGAGEAKVDGGDEVTGDEVVQRLAVLERQRELQQLFEAHFTAVAKEVAQASELMGLSTDLPDTVARSIIAAGGRRSGLIDLSAEARSSLFRALAEGRALGEGVDQLTARIRDQVGGGPWTTPDVRARVIARTETKFAQNASTLGLARANGVERFFVLDGRLGPGRSVPSHIARSGSIVTADQASEWVATEHPNGTISIAPYLGD